MKLISMVDFVLQFEKPVGYYEDQSDFLHCQVEHMGKVMNYALFLKQPLKLEMFVPCDEEGNYWKFPPTKEEWDWARKDSTEAEQSFKQKKYYYQKAKEKILFKGFCLVLEEDSIYKDSEHFIDLVALTAFTIEDISTWEDEIELSSSAIKQIGL